MQNGVILNKLQTMDELLNELKSLGKATVSQLEEDWLNFGISLFIATNVSIPKY